MKLIIGRAIMKDLMSRLNIPIVSREGISFLYKRGRRKAARIRRRFRRIYKVMKVVLRKVGLMKVTRVVRRQVRMKRRRVRRIRAIWRVLFKKRSHPKTAQNKAETKTSTPQA